MRRSSSPKPFYVTFLAGLFSLGCATNDGDGSETHLVRCKSDADCVDAGQGARCVSNACVVQGTGKRSSDASGTEDTSSSSLVIPPPHEASVDGRTTVPDVTIDGAPLGGPAMFAVKSSYGVDEEVWLFGAGKRDGAVPVSDAGGPAPEAFAHVSAWPRDGRLDCAGFAWSTGGYPEGSGRFGAVLFDHTGKYLVLREKLADICPGVQMTRDERLVAYDIANGHMKELFHGVLGSVPLVTDGATVGVRSASSDTVPPTYDAAYDIASGAATPITLTPARKPSQTAWPSLVHFSGAPLLVVPGFEPMERRGGAFVPSHALDGVTGDIRYVGGAARDDRLCVVAASADASAATASGFILGGGAPVSVPVSLGSTCGFAPGGGAVFFTGGGGTDVFDEAGAALGHYAGVYIFGATTDAAWGAQGSTVVRWTFASKTLEPVVDGARLAKCVGSGAVASVVGVYPEPASGKSVLVKVSCGCIDCDDSATFLLHTDTVATAPVEGEGEHDVYGVASLGAAGFLFTSSEGSGSDPRQGSPPAGTYRIVSLAGSVALLGPFAGIERVVHAPATPSWGDAWGNPHMQWNWGGAE